MVAQHFPQVCIESCGFYLGLATSDHRCVGVQQNKQGSRREKLAALAKQCGQRFFEPPKFTPRATAKTGWIKNEAVVVAAASDFACDEGWSVVDEPADGAVFKPREQLIFASPLDGFLGSIDVSDVGSRGGARERSETGVAKKGENFRRRGGGFNESSEPIPVAGLIGKYAQVTGRCGRSPEAEILTAHPPARRKRLSRSPCALLRVLRLDKFGVRRVPNFLWERTRPDGLRLGSNQ